MNIRDATSNDLPAIVGPVASAGPLDPPDECTDVDAAFEQHAVDVGIAVALLYLQWLPAARAITTASFST